MAADQRPVGVRSPVAYKRRLEEVIHFSAAVRVGDLVVVSGITGRDADGNVIADAAGQYRALFEEVELTLEAAGSSWADVISMNSFHQAGTPEDRALFTEMRKEYVTEPYPAWTAVTVAALQSPAVLVEVQVMAVLSRGG